MAVYYFLFVIFKQKTAYEMRISDWSSDVCSSDLPGELRPIFTTRVRREIVELSGTDSAGRLKIIEAAFDLGEIAAADAREPLAEIELELREGSPAALFELALALQEVAPTRIEKIGRAHV